MENKLFYNVEVVNLRTCVDWGKPGDIRVDRTTKWCAPKRCHAEVLKKIIEEMHYNDNLS